MQSSLSSKPLRTVWNLGVRIRVLASGYQINFKPN